MKTRYICTICDYKSDHLIMGIINHHTDNSQIDPLIGLHVHLFCRSSPSKGLFVLLGIALVLTWHPAAPPPPPHQPCTARQKSNQPLTTHFPRQPIFADERASLFITNLSLMSCRPGWAVKRHDFHGQLLLGDTVISILELTIRLYVFNSNRLR